MHFLKFSLEVKMEREATKLEPKLLAFSELIYLHVSPRSPCYGCFDHQ